MLVNIIMVIPSIKQLRLLTVHVFLHFASIPHCDAELFEAKSKMRDFIQ